MSVGKVCNRNVVIIDRQSSVQDAVRLMREYHVGDVVVVDEQDGKRVPVGILTDRDIVIELDAPQLKLDEFTVNDVMSWELMTVSEDDELLQVIEMMQTKKVRRAPVVNSEGVLVGILTADDLVELIGEMLTSLSKLVTRQQQRERSRRSS